MGWRVVGWGGGGWGGGDGRGGALCHPNSPTIHPTPPLSDLGVHGGVGDPILLGQGRGRVHVPRARLLVVRRGRRHFDRVVAVPQLGQGEAAGDVQAVHCRHQGVHVAGSAQLQHCTRKQVEMHRRLGRHRPVRKAAHVVGGKDVQGVVAGRGGKGRGGRGWARGARVKGARGGRRGAAWQPAPARRAARPPTERNTYPKPPSLPSQPAPIPPKPPPTPPPPPHRKSIIDTTPARHTARRRR